MEQVAGTCAVSFQDIEVNGSDYYMSYMGVRGTNLYAYVMKYTGSSWTFVGDSILIGGVGQGGSFDFLLDNNGVPTILGIQKTAFGNKTVKQFTSGVWSTTYEIPNSTSAIFKDGSAMYDASNKLNCLSGGIKTLSAPPFVQYYALGLKIDGPTSSMVGDTIYVNNTNGKFKIDSLGNSYALLNDLTKAEFLSYKLTGNTWNYIADTIGVNASMINADVTNDGKVVFSTSQNNLIKGLHMYNNGTRIAMDTLNISGFAVGAISDLVVHKGSVYVLLYETKASVVSDYSIMKHSLAAAPNNINKITSEQYVSIYPNPSEGKFVVHTSLSTAQFSVFNLLGPQVLPEQSSSEIDLSNFPKGIYFVVIQDGKSTINKKIIIQ